MKYHTTEIAVCRYSKLCRQTYGICFYQRASPLWRFGIVITNCSCNCVLALPHNIRHLLCLHIDSILIALLIQSVADRHIHISKHEVKSYILNGCLVMVTKEFKKFQITYKPKRYLDIFSCDQAALRTLQSVCLSVCPTVCLSVTPFSQCFSHSIMMKFSGVITNAKSDVHTKGHGQRSKDKDTEVKTQLSRFQIVTSFWIHTWQWNCA